MVTHTHHKLSIFYQIVEPKFKTVQKTTDQDQWTATAIYSIDLIGHLELVKQEIILTQTFEKLV